MVTGVTWCWGQKQETKVTASSCARLSDAVFRENVVAEQVPLLRDQKRVRLAKVTRRVNRYPRQSVRKRIRVQVHPTELI